MLVFDLTKWCQIYSELFHTVHKLVIKYEDIAKTSELDFCSFYGVVMVHWWEAINWEL
jgi:hypothetical protein